MAAGPAAIQVRILRNLLLSVACLVFDAEVGHEGEAADFAPELFEPTGGGVVGVVEEVVAGGVAADRNAVPLPHADLTLIALPAGVEFAAEGFGPGAFDLHSFRAGAAGLPRSDGAVGGRGQLAPGKGTGAETCAGAKDGKDAAFLQRVEVPLAETVFGESRGPGGQGDAAVASVFGDPDGHGVGHGGWSADGPGAPGEEAKEQPDHGASQRMAAA